MDGVSPTLRPFYPAGWASGPHAQTLIGRALRSGHGPPYQRERVATPDGDFVDLDWGPDPGPDAPIVLVLHGLEGSSNRSYVRSVARELLANGIRPVAMNFRGCSGEPNRGLRLYHSGETEDPGLVLAILRERYPDRRIGAVGFSLGGNVLLKLIGEHPDGGGGALDAAVAMSVPYDLAAGCELMEQGLMGRFYTSYFMRSLRGKLEARRADLGAVVDIPAALATKTIRAFDDHVTAPVHGFASAADYYARCSSASFLSGIRVPTLLLHARDDPFLPASAIPFRAIEGNPSLTLALHAKGGHVGFLEGVPWAPCFWADEAVAYFLRRSLWSRAEARGRDATAR